MTWEQWAMLESCTDLDRVLFNWAFFICAGIVSKLVADWIAPK